MNINTIAIVEYLSTNESARTALAAQAKVYAEKSDDAKASAALETAQKLALPLGWAALAREYEVAKPASCLARVVFVLDTVLGWILTIAAVSLGAPFWFGLLNKLVALRASLKPPDAGASAAPAPPAQGGAADSARMGFGAKPAAPPNPMQGTPYQDDDTLDACCVVAGEPTPDEALPAAKGGVA